MSGEVPADLGRARLPSLRRRLRIAHPTEKKPTSIVSHMPGSGTDGTAGNSGGRFGKPGPGGTPGLPPGVARLAPSRSSPGMNGKGGKPPDGPRRVGPTSSNKDGKNAGPSPVPGWGLNADGGSVPVSSGRKAALGTSSRNSIGVGEPGVNGILVWASSPTPRSPGDRPAKTDNGSVSTDCKTALPFAPPTPSEIAGRPRSSRTVANLRPCVELISCIQPAAPSWGLKCFTVVFRWFS